jgi:hypothetical protein
MAEKRFSLIARATSSHGIQAPSAATTDITPEQVGGSAKGYRVTKRTYRGGLSEGVDAIEVDNGKLAFEIVPTRGMGIRWARQDKFEFKWDSPVPGPVHPQFVPVAESSGLGWLDGFDELLARCGLESNGAPEFDDQGRVKYPLHGRIANKPAESVEAVINDQTGEIQLLGRVAEVRFHFFKLWLQTTIATKPDESVIRIRDEITNASDSPTTFQMLYHVNYGHPLLDAGSRVIAPVKTVVPRNANAAKGIQSWDSYSAPEPGVEEQVYFFALNAAVDGKTQALLRNAHGTHGASLVFNVQQLPCFSLWKNTTGLKDGYVTGLEPGTNFPNPRSYETQQGRVVSLQPGGKAALEIELHFHTTKEQVQSAERAIAAIQGDKQPQVFDTPQEGWCAP